MAENCSNSRHRYKKYIIPYWFYWKYLL